MTDTLEDSPRDLPTAQPANGVHKGEMLMRPTVVERGVSSVRRRVTTVLEKFRATPDQVLPLKFNKLAASGDVDGIKALLAKVAGKIARPFDLGDYDKRCPLHLACENGHLEAVKCLVEAGANINCVDRWGMTPLGSAALYGHTEIQDYLRALGAKVGDDVFANISEKLTGVRSRRTARSLFASIHKADSAAVSVEQFEQFLRRYGLDVRIHKALVIELEGVTVPAERGMLNGLGEPARGMVQWQTLCKFIETKTDSVLAKVFGGRLAIADWREFNRVIKEVFDEVCRDVPPSAGQNAQYIPELADVDPSKFSVCVFSCDGQLASFGDSEEYFSIQSCMKPLLYSFNLQEMGPEHVHTYVGREPSGAAFNAFTLNADSKPHNSCINAGAIMNSALYHPELSLSRRYGRFTESLRKLAGGFRPTFSQSVYLSEKGCAYNNMALAYFMKAKNAFPEKIDFVEAVDFYFQLCSIEVTAQLLASVAATYANNGVNPLTREPIFSEDVVKANLQLMFSAGMYDFSGEWACTVGLPAKSGVGGAIYFVVPNVAGVCVFSPPLDDIGNSVRAVEFCKRVECRAMCFEADGVRSSSVDCRWALWIFVLVLPRKKTTLVNHSFEVASY